MEFRFFFVCKVKEVVWEKVVKFDYIFIFNCDDENKYIILKRLELLIYNEFI